MTDPRAEAASILAGMLASRRNLDRVMAERPAPDMDPRDRALVQELCFGVLRSWFRLQFIADSFLEKPIRSRDMDVRMLLLCGLYQLRTLRVPDHAAIAATVEATGALGKEWAKGLINAVLRRYQREADEVERRAEEDRSARFSFPEWLLDELARDWPEHWPGIIDASNARPPFHIRVNTQRCARADYLRRLADAGIEAESSALAPAGIRLSSPLDVHALPGFDEGLFAVQDFGAQLAAGLLDARPGQRVLDACAAPGGKTTHISEACPALGELLALEVDAKRAARLRDNVARMGARAAVRRGDAGVPDSWWDGQPFARILLDVPCSATGVIRRHPDIKVLRTAGQCAELVQTQKGLLSTLWPLLARGGRLLYASCSLLSAENDAQIENFLAVNKDASLIRIDAPWGLPVRYGRQTMPGMDDADGFYYALLERN